MRNLIIKGCRAVFGWPPLPAPFAEKQALITRIDRETGAQIFVETGTFRGELIDARRERFQKLIGVELSEGLVQTDRLKPPAKQPRFRAMGLATLRLSGRWMEGWIGHAPKSA